uniref:Uncharacterized protein n=1 Tax=Arundo donax TaxID=35708 RepID=A0A0A9TDB7_ARUDO
MNLEIVDYNYKNLIDQKGKLVMVKDLKVKYDVLAYRVHGVWSKLVKQLNIVANCQHELCHHVASVTKDSQEHTVLLKCAGDIEKFCAKLNSRHQISFYDTEAFHVLGNVAVVGDFCVSHILVEIS